MLFSFWMNNKSTSQHFVSKHELLGFYIISNSHFHFYASEISLWQSKRQGQRKEKWITHRLCLRSFLLDVAGRNTGRVDGCRCQSSQGVCVNTESYKTLWVQYSDLYVPLCRNESFTVMYHSVMGLLLNVSLYSDTFTVMYHPVMSLFAHHFVHIMSLVYCTNV